MTYPNQTTFSANDHVRVKQGVTDFDYPDMPLGGWVGTVMDVEEGGGTTCLVRWSQETLQAMSPRYRDRCEQDGIDCEEKWLDQDDLETAPRTRPTVEQQTGAISRRRSEQHDLDSQERWSDEGGR